MENVLSKFKQIRHFVFDIDGVLTDGSLLVSADGTLLRKMNIKDGYAMQLAIKKGYSISIISGAKEEGVLKRLQGLGIKDVFLGVDAKAACLSNLVNHQALTLEHTLYMGDDMPDVEPMGQVFLASCPSDAVPEIKEIAHYISPFTGGTGCVRDVIEKVLKLNQHWQ